jgi:hypothetical protein
MRARLKRRGYRNNMNTQVVSTSKGFLNTVRHWSPATVAGAVLVPLGAWAALEPFLLGGWDWSWHTGRYLLAVVPGIAAMVGGLIMLSARPRAVIAGGSLALAAGVWFVVAPIAYSIFASTTLGTESTGESIRMAAWIPYFFGVGALISLVSAHGLGLIRPMQFADEDWSEQPQPSARPRRRVPATPERTRRERGAKESVRGRARPQASNPGSPKRDS